MNQKRVERALRLLRAWEDAHENINEETGGIDVNDVVDKCREALTEDEILVRMFIDEVYGHVEGLFVCKKTELKRILGKDLYFGEILGKHSSVSIFLEENDIEILSEDPDFINHLQNTTRRKRTIFGYNPFDFLDEE